MRLLSLGISVASSIPLLLGCGDSLSFSGNGSNDVEAIQQRAIDQLADIVRRAERNSHWSRRHETTLKKAIFTETDFDVTKSDSIIRPFDGKIVTRLSYSVGSDDSETVGECVYQILLTYKDQQWVPQSDTLIALRVALISGKGTAHESRKVLVDESNPKVLDRYLSRWYFGQDLRPVAYNRFEFANELQRE